MEFMNSEEIEKYGNLQERMNLAEEFLMNPPEDTRRPGDWYAAELDRRRWCIDLVLGVTCQSPGCETITQYPRKPGPDRPKWKISKSKDIGRRRFLDALPRSEALCAKHGHDLRIAVQKQHHRFPLTVEWLKSPLRTRWELPPEEIYNEIAFFTANRQVLTYVRPYPHELPEPTEKQQLAVFNFQGWATTP